MSRNSDKIVLFGGGANSTLNPFGRPTIEAKSNPFNRNQLSGFGVGTGVANMFGTTGGFLPNNNTLNPLKQ